MDPIRRAIETALEANWKRLYGYALSLTRNPDDARDLIQQSAVNALASSNAPSDPKALRAWLFRILRNAWIDQYRRTKVRMDEDSAGQRDDAGWNYDDRIIAGITVRQGLSVIDPLFREVIELVDIHGFQYTDVAVVLDVPIGTVMSRLSRARLSLLEVIAGDNLRPMQTLRARRK